MITCPRCFGKRVVSMDDQSDPLGMKVCPLCWGHGTVKDDRPDARDEVQKLQARLAAALEDKKHADDWRRLMTHHHDQGRTTAYVLLQEHGYTGTWQEFMTLWYGTKDTLFPR